VAGRRDRPSAEEDEIWALLDELEELEALVDSDAER